MELAIVVVAVAIVVIVDSSKVLSKEGRGVERLLLFAPSQKKEKGEERLEVGKWAGEGKAKGFRL